MKVSPFVRNLVTVALFAGFAVLDLHVVTVLGGAR